MSAAVMSPTPALPSARKASIWDKVVSGLKKPSKKSEAVEHEHVSPPVEAPAMVADHSMFAGFDMNSKSQQTAMVDDCDQSPEDTRPRHMSVASGIDSHSPQVHLRNASTQSRSQSVAAPSIKSTKSSGGRSGSISGAFARRGSKFWNSSNSDDDAPPVPAIESKFKIFGSHNPDVTEAPAPSPPTSRRPSYVPRNAAGSFLSTTTTKGRRASVDDVNGQPSASGESRVRQPSVTGEYRSRQASIASGELRTRQPSTAGADSRPVTENRKDSHVGAEKVGMFSMAGICDIVEDVAGEQDDAATTTTTTARVSISSHKKTDSVTKDTTLRSDSAKGSPEMLATKTDAQREPSLLEAAAV